MQTAALAFLGFVVLERLGELALARWNTARLLERWATEVGAAHYPAMVAVHSAWVACLLILSHDRTVMPGWLAL
ncbi:hypothetical protein AB1M95_00050 [Sulfitobacter sp. LCG007]